ncbi:ribosome biogenesis protein NOP53 [Anopheles marshallii]|uniref:ribosome biogenesis protein NOP53 n=1 Tax=Anopheles marshallii TaxID=1521116 RepID=UPI00237B798B|nr:ribosome biogenesis protein NOP53 [Anopheles marshallii]
MSKKHVSRKLKSAWRKHIDISDVDQFLEEQRQDERVGSQLAEKPSVELFREEKKPTKPKASLREIRKKKFDELPRSLLPLVNTSNVGDPIVKRNIKKNRDTRIPVTPAPVRIKRKGRASGIAAATPEDIWAKDTVPEELKNEWISQDVVNHTLRHVGKPLVTNLPARMDKLQRHIPLDKKLPNEGISYNPAIDDYLHLKNKVVKQEQAIIRKEQHFDRVVTKMFVKTTREEKQQTALKEMSEGLLNAEKGESEDEHSTEDAGPAAVVAKRKKPITRAKKRARELQEQKEKLIQVELNKLMEIDRLGAIKKEIRQKERKTIYKAKQRVKKKQALREKINLPIDFVEPEQLSGSLRTIKPLNNLLATGLPKIRKVSILKKTRSEAQRKKRRVLTVRYKRSSHKELMPETAI